MRVNRKLYDERNLYGTTLKRDPEDIAECLHFHA